MPATAGPLPPRQLRCLIEVPAVEFGFLSLAGTVARAIAFAVTDMVRFIANVYDTLNPADPLVIRPITAYDVPEPTE